MEEQKVEVQLGGQTLSISTGKMAKLAGGSAVVQLGGTVVLVAASAAKTAKPGLDFVPLMVDYRERTYASGKIPGGFFKREGRPRERETLISRLIDRSIRPFFPEGLCHKVQISLVLLSSDGENDPAIPALIAASTALSISAIPFNGPVAC